MPEISHTTQSAAISALIGECFTCARHIVRHGDVLGEIAIDKKPRIIAALRELGYSDAEGTWDRAIDFTREQYGESAA